MKYSFDNNKKRGALLGFIFNPRFLILGFILAIAIINKRWDTEVFIGMLLFATFGLLSPLRYLYYHLKFAYKKELIIDKNETEFYFGNKDSLRTYSKNDVQELHYHKAAFKSNRDLYESVDIVFKSGDYIPIPRILLAPHTLIEHFTGFNIVEDEENDVHFNYVSNKNNW